ncbi:hypothetical protein VDG1235_318 [Verrucomicrobiia bacterium DG1235]|nr:hypothetical protein VDG1235_318 [Verrucomicrobiae bacterium DG1235]
MLNMREATELGETISEINIDSFHQIGEVISNALEEHGLKASLKSDTFDPRSLPTLKGGSYHPQLILHQYNLQSALEQESNDYALILDLDKLAVYEDLSAPIKLVGKRTKTVVHGILYNIREQKVESEFRTYLIRNIKVKWRSSSVFDQIETELNKNIALSAAAILERLFPEQDLSSDLKISKARDSKREEIYDQIRRIRARSDDFSGVMDCSDYYPLTQNCKSRDRLQIRISGHNLEFSANTDGTIVFMSYTAHNTDFEYGKSTPWHRSSPTESLYEVYSLFESHGIKVEKIDSFNIIEPKPGFFIHCDSNAFDLIKALAEKAPNKGRRPPPPKGSRGKGRP